MCLNVGVQLCVKTKACQSFSNTKVICFDWNAQTIPRVLFGNNMVFEIAMRKKRSDAQANKT